MSPSRTPTPPQSAPQPHARGVFRDEDSFAGTVAFRVFDCAGELLVEVAVQERLADDVERWLCAFVDTVCPLDADIHARVCQVASRLSRPRRHPLFVVPGDHP